ncbi:MAG TPA: peptide chain release factor N(5)-glutamine methyltransferase [Pseudolabrys sp.]|nr:peptide chain release factor N(5)-glutamine methyltransferase [Pseudolabrys sp.]
MRIVPGLKDGATVAEAQRLMIQSFRLAGIESPEADARLLLAHALRVDRAGLLAESDRLLEAREVKAVQALAARRLRREPVSRIFGVKEFWSLPLQVTEAVLVPRPETETVVELALDLIDRTGLRREYLRILDIGTGSGAIALALLSELPNAVATMTDISAQALAIARVNTVAHKMNARCAFTVCDIADGVDGPFDLIVSNPPYIAHGDIAALDPEVHAYDPMLALDGGNDGLDTYRAIARDAPHLLAPGGRLVVELGRGQEAAVRALLTEAGLTVGNARADLAAIPRALPAQKRP